MDGSGPVRNTRCTPPPGLDVAMLESAYRTPLRNAMRTTRRRVLGGLAYGAAAGALPPWWPRAARAQDDSAALTRRLAADLERHASFGDKFAGGPGDLATADWVIGRLRMAGYRVAESAFEAPFFVKRAVRLSAGAATTADLIPQAPVVPTGSGGVAGRLVLVEDAVGDVRGKIALIVAPFARYAALFPDRGIGKTVVAAAQGGAVAVIIVTTGPSGEAVALNAPEQPFVPVPTAVLAPKSAAPFVAAARAGGEATLVLDGEATHRPSKNIVARLARGDRWLAISTPRSGWFGCVGERGTGTAAFLELAEWAGRRFPDLSVFLMNTGGHEYFFAGSHRVLHEAPPPTDTLAWVHIGATLAARDAVQRDGKLVMLDTADAGRTLMTTAVARAAVTEAFQGLTGLAQPVDVRPKAGELSTFTDLGYAKAFAVIGQHAWFHTRLDTLERVDAKLLTPVVRAHQRATELLIGAG
jgi:hypothetical protein